MSALKYNFDCTFLDTTAQVIAHVCDCTSTRETGLARQIAEKFPHARPYSGKTNTYSRKPGSVELWGSTKTDQRYVLGIFSHSGPGKARDGDTEDLRVQWFEKCLWKFTRQLERSGCLKALESITFPADFGCVSNEHQKTISRRHEAVLETWAKKHPHVTVEVVPHKKTAERMHIGGLGNSLEKPQAPVATEQKLGAPQPPQAAPPLADPPVPGDDYWEGEAYKGIEKQIYDWASTATFQWTNIPATQEDLTVLADELAGQLSRDIPILHAQLSKITSVADDLYSLLEEKI